MHEKYTTPAFIVAMRNSKDADRIVSVLTKDFGLISVLFTGVRHGKSKFKGFLEIGNNCFITVVKGRLIYRGTDVIASDTMKLTKENQPSFLRLLLLIQKLVRGEEKNETLFETINAVNSFLHRRVYTRETLECIECIGALRILGSLGYGKPCDQNISLVGSITDADVLKALEYKQDLIKTINLALFQSHL